MSVTSTWLSRLRADPLPFLLETSDPAVRHATLRGLLDRPDSDPEVALALARTMAAEPVVSILAHQHPQGWWEKPGPGYASKYRGTVWSLMFLDQLGADAADPRVQAACEYVLRHSQCPEGGFSASGTHLVAPPPSYHAIHCLNGNLVHALVGLGRLGDPRLARAIEWQARAIAGEEPINYHPRGTVGPGFACADTSGLPCAWGAVKAVLALARIPAGQRSPLVRRALAAGAAFLLSRDPVAADYPLGYGEPAPSAEWWRLGFPLGYVADVLQNLEALCAAGYANDARLTGAVDWVLGQQDNLGRWRNQRAYNGKTWTVIERQGRPSKWVTLRACRVLRHVWD
jgi:hypothetical protein